jgi:hypothetical protein
MYMSFRLERERARYTSLCRKMSQLDVRGKKLPLQGEGIIRKKKCNFCGERHKMPVTLFSTQLLA